MGKDIYEGAADMADSAAKKLGLKENEPTLTNWSKTPIIYLISSTLYITNNDFAMRNALKYYNINLLYILKKI